MRWRLIVATIALVMTASLSAAPENKGPKPDVGTAASRGSTSRRPTLRSRRNSTRSSSAGSSGRCPEREGGGDRLRRPVDRNASRRQGQDRPFDGVVYIQVEDIPASCKKAKELGGKIPPGFPFNLSDGKGAIALVADPSGHPVGMYSRTPLPAAAK